MDWPGLLKWSLQYQDGTSDRPRMAETDINFLRNSIAEYLSTVEDPNKIVQASCRVIRDSMGVDDAATLASLELVHKIIDEDPEISRTLPKLNVTDVLVDVLQSRRPKQVLEVLQTFSTALQNNPVLQSHMYSDNFLETLFIHLKPKVVFALTDEVPLSSSWPIVPVADVPPAAPHLTNDEQESTVKEDATQPFNQSNHINPNNGVHTESNDSVNNLMAIAPCNPKPTGPLVCTSVEEAQSIQTAAMGAISGLVRNNDKISKNFVQLGGMRILSTAFLPSETFPSSHRVQIKAANLLKTLIAERCVTVQNVAKSLIISGVRSMLTRRDVEASGLVYGEVVAQLLTELLHQMRFPLAQRSLLTVLYDPLVERVSWLESDSVFSKDFDPSEELKLLKECCQLIRVASLSKKMSKSS